MLTVISDPGVDDLVALTLLSKLSQSKDVSLISSFGNVALDLTDKNLREFLSFVSPSWSYFKGSKLPLAGKVQAPWAEFFHGGDGVWGVHPKISMGKINILKKYPINDEVISLGPLTDLYKLQQKVSLTSVTIMGGAFFVPGNETKYAEFNVAADPEGAAAFFNNLSEKTKVRIVPLDGTGKVTWPIKKIKKIPETNKVNIWLKELLLTWFNNYHNKEVGFELYDPLAVYLHFYPEKAKWIKGNVGIILKGEKRGKTTLEENLNSSCEVAIKVLNPKAISENIFKRVFES